MNKLDKFTSRSASAVLICIAVFITSLAFLDPYESPLQESTFQVIINGDINVDSVTLDEIRRIYLGKKHSLAGNNINRIAALRSGRTHEEFLAGCLKRSHSSFINYWKRMVFTGKGVMPLVFQDESALVDFVRRNKSAIGYISSGTSHKGVTAITVFK